MPLTTPNRTPALRLSEVAPLGFTVVALGLMLRPDINHAEIIGVLASVLAFAVFIPQAVRVWRSRNDHHALLGVSITSFVFIVNNSIVWGLYAWTVGEFWVGAAGIINLPLAVMIVAVIIRSRIKNQVHPSEVYTTEQEDPNHA